MAGTVVLACFAIAGYYFFFQSSSFLQKNPTQSLLVDTPWSQKYEKKIGLIHFDPKSTKKNFLCWHILIPKVPKNTFWVDTSWYTLILNFQTQNFLWSLWSRWSMCMKGSRCIKIVSMCINLAWFGLGIYKLRAPKIEFWCLRALPSRFFFNHLPSFFLRAFLVSPQNALSFFFFSPHFLLALFFLEGALLSFFLKLFGL